MLDRMSPKDDKRGFGGGLNGNLATPGKLRLLLERRSEVVKRGGREGEYGYTVEFPSQLSHLVQQSLLHHPYLSYKQDSPNPSDSEQKDLPEPVQMM